MLNLSLKELEVKAENRGIKGYKSISIDKLLNILDASEPIKRTKAIKDIRKENYEADKILRGLGFLLDPRKDHYEPKKAVSTSNNNYIQYESIGDKDNSLSIKKYLDMIRPYLKGIINDHKTQGEWKIHLTIAIKFMSSKDFDETRIMHSKIDNIGTMIGNEID